MIGPVTDGLERGKNALCFNRNLFSVDQHHVIYSAKHRAEKV